MKDHGPVTILDVLDEDTLTSALRCISHRKGSPGIDGIKGENLPEYWEKSSQEITKRLLHGIYRPHPVVTIKIPKPNSTEKRRIEIPCVVDRMLQTALLYVLSPCFEPSFLPSSYAFRKGGGCHKALECCLRELRLNTSWVIDLDIRHFFDKVDHGILLSIIKRTIRDKRLLNLISAYIGVDVMNGGSVYRKRRGLSQGGPLSPLLANIYLNELDLFLYRIDAHYVRYADDMLLFCKTREDALNLLELVQDYLKDYLHLSLNEEKTKIIRPWEVRFLGHSFIQENENSFPHYVLALDTKTEIRMLQRMKRNIRRSLPADRSRKKIIRNRSMLWERLGGFNRGWVQYFGKVRMIEMIHFLNEAEQFQVSLLVKEFHRIKKEDRICLLNALYECPGFNTLTGWYMIRYLKGNPDEERNLELNMANKYCFWRSGSFYPVRTALYKSWHTYSNLPFYMSVSNDERTHDYQLVKSRKLHPWTPFPDLSVTELNALGILAAGRNMTESQLAAFLKLKAIKLSVPEVQAMLEKFLTDGLVEKVSISPAPPSLRSAFSMPEHQTVVNNQPFPMTTWRVVGRGKKILRKIGAPADNRIFSLGKAERDTQIAHFYMDTVLFNQIILQSLLACPGFRFFEICNGYNMEDQKKAYVPLYIETEDGNWLFWHLYTDSSWDFNTALHNWELFCRRRRPCNLVLITSSDIVRQMAIQHLRIIREKDSINGNKAPDSEPSAKRIFLSEAAAWFSSVPIKSGNLPLFLSPKSKPLRSSPED